VLTEKELQVKIADLGNACWTVSFSCQNIFWYIYSLMLDNKSI
jgi:hypothetical protein